MKDKIVFRVNEISKLKYELYANEQLIDIIHDPTENLWIIKNSSTGNQHSCHPNIDSSRSVKGMINLGHWKKEHPIYKFKGTYYNMGMTVISDEFDKLCHMLENFEIQLPLFIGQMDGLEIYLNN